MGITACHDAVPVYLKVLPRRREHTYLKDGVVLKGSAALQIIALFDLTLYHSRLKCVLIKIWT